MIATSNETISWSVLLAFDRRIYSLVCFIHTFTTYTWLAKHTKHLQSVRHCWKLEAVSRVQCAFCMSISFIQLVLLCLFIIYYAIESINSEKEWAREREVKKIAFAIYNNKKRIVFEDKSWNVFKFFFCCRRLALMVPIHSLISSIYFSLSAYIGRI